ncbi:hypothetical protein BACCELL_01399 [Bacteroides cellulosilyticus DSM 14838]|uniref:Uncharacterized protein n=1 Tax=Bacteroides cellulosilyticus DSM 14838 TaxID=537012 RepID=E2NAU3_9BACE|nr:hypothetical protein BACCELL_01399 [Bacteroides cellulosilyticus DSM 14838]
MYIIKIQIIYDMAKPWLGQVRALFHYMLSLPQDMKRGCTRILIHPLFLSHNVILYTSYN